MSQSIQLFRVWGRGWKPPQFIPAKEFQFFGEQTLQGVFNILSGPMYVLQRFTGFKDQKGKDVYEGDILKYFGEAGDFFSVVRFGKYFYSNKPDKYFRHCDGAEMNHVSHGIGFYLEHLTGKEKGRISSIWTAFDPFSQDEVVGNIFENPELLN